MVVGYLLRSSRAKAALASLGLISLFFILTFQWLSLPGVRQSSATPPSFELPPTVSTPENPSRLNDIGFESHGDHPADVKQSPSPLPSHTLSQPHHPTQSQQEPVGPVELWRQLQPLLDAYSPGCPSPERLGSSGAIGFEPSKGEQERVDLLKMPEDDIAKMRQAHSSFVHAAKTKIPQGCYVPGTRGLVSTAGGFYLPVLVISLRMLRRSGSNLPMEVFLASSDEYEPYICDNVLPKLNARCVVLSEILDKAPNAQEIKHYQFKIFAMIFSSFEEVVFLDADAFPLYDPEMLLTSEPFTKTGLVLWPDYWVSTASPLYYNISAQVAPPISLRQSSETGELLVSKSQHHASLMLATYYNYYGPNHYYPLLGQGCPGEGDKDTFIAAASAMGEPFYQTSERVKPIGHRNADGGIGGSAMVQFDPIQDYNLTSKGLWRVKDERVASMPRPFFIHAHYPKFNPATIFDPSEVEPTRGPNGEFSRAWLIPEDIVGAFGYDVEKNFWEEIKWTACELETSFRTWTGKTKVCERVTFYWDSVFESKHESG